MSYYVIERADPRNLSANITSTSGRVYRWGPDEKDAENIPSGLAITTQMPGGFGTLDCQLQRRPDLPYGDLDRFAPITVTGGGGSLVAFDGYLSSRPFDRSDSYSFSPEAIGWSGHLKDDTSFSMVYIDRKLSAWGPPGAARNLINIAVPRDIAFYSSSTLVDSGGAPSLSVSGSGPIPGTIPLIELWYDSGATNQIATFQMSKGTLLNYGNPDTNNRLDAYSVASDTATGAVGFFALTSANSGSGISASNTPQRYFLLQHYYLVVNAGASGVTYGWQLANPAVIGNHGLTLQLGPSGVSPGGDDGFLGGDIVADIVSRAAPLLSVSRGAGGVADDTFVIPQMAFNSPIDADTAIQQVNQYYLNDYGVYEDKAFFWQPPGTGRQWRVRVGDGTKVTDQGPQIETAFNGVIVQFTDPSGMTRFVGPPGTGLPAYTLDMTSQDASSTTLVDTSVTNACNLYGRKRWAFVQMGTTTTGGAIAVGVLFLQLTTSRPSSGTITITGFARDSTGRDWPAWMVRSGDTVVVEDTSDLTAHYILNTSYAHDSLTNTLTVDAPPNKLDWILQRLGLVISAIS